MPSTEMFAYPSKVVVKDAMHALFLIVELLLAENRMSEDISTLSIAANQDTVVVFLAAINLFRDGTR